MEALTTPPKRALGNAMERALATITRYKANGEVDPLGGTGVEKATAQAV